MLFFLEFAKIQIKRYSNVKVFGMLVAKKVNVDLSNVTIFSIFLVDFRDSCNAPPLHV